MGIVFAHGGTHWKYLFWDRVCVEWPIVGVYVERQLWDCENIKEDVALSVLLAVV